MKRSPKTSRKIVVKVGSSVLTGGGTTIIAENLNRIVQHIARFWRQGDHVIVVTSGAIASGLSVLGLKKRPTQLAEQQAAAATGANLLMRFYGSEMESLNLKCAQILLTREDLSDRARYLNIKNTIATLLRFKVIPIINENDAVSTDEIKFGDNDVLSALVAAAVEADGLLILTDTEGLYKEYDAKKKIICSPIKDVDEITPEIKKAACGTNKFSCVGGMATKVEAARIATSVGIPVILAKGLKEPPLNIDFQAESYNDYDGTRFLANRSLGSRKHWIAFGAMPKGKIVVDDGARAALVDNGKSLLSPGVKELEGEFSPKDVVEVVDLKGETFAKGRVCFSSAELRNSRGKKLKSEVIHRDDLVILR